MQGSEFLAQLWRRRTIITAVFALCCGVHGAILFSRSELYVCEALVQVRAARLEDPREVRRARNRVRRTALVDVSFSGAQQRIRRGKRRLSVCELSCAFLDPGQETGRQGKVVHRLRAAVALARMHDS